MVGMPEKSREYLFQMSLLKTIEKVILFQI